MIYVLIAGSYTPIILKFMLRAQLCLSRVIWLIALTGIAIKLLWIDAPRLIAPRCTSRLGWAIAFDFGVVLSMPRLPLPFWLPEVWRIPVGGLIYIAKSESRADDRVS